MLSSQCGRSIRSVSLENSMLEFLIIRLAGGCGEITKPGVIELQPRKIGEDKFRARMRGSPLKSITLMQY